MDTEKQEEFQEVEWTIVIQCVKEGNNPPPLQNNNELLWKCTSTYFKV